MKVCVISGGGSWGAFGGGTLEKLNNDYDKVFGISTGSLLSSHTALKDFSTLRTAYTSVNQKDIFNVNPFTKSGGDDYFMFLFRQIIGKKTAGETAALRKRIGEYLTHQNYIDLLKADKEIVVAVKNITTYQVEYKSSKEEAYEDFCDWIWASCNPPIYASLLRKNDSEYCDAGVSELIALRQAVTMGATDIDVIMHRPKPTAFRLGYIKDLSQNVFRSIDMLRYNSFYDSVTEGLQQAKLNKCRVRFIWLPRDLEKDSFIFDQAAMTSWWSEGYDTATSENRIELYDYTEQT